MQRRLNHDQINAKTPLENEDTVPVPIFWYISLICTTMITVTAFEFYQQRESEALRRKWTELATKEIVYLRGKVAYLEKLLQTERKGALRK
jgi:hypothetical protein